MVGRKQGTYFPKHPNTLISLAIISSDISYQLAKGNWFTTFFHRTHFTFGLKKPRTTTSICFCLQLTLTPKCFNLYLLLVLLTWGKRDCLEVVVLDIHLTDSYTMHAKNVFPEPKSKRLEKNQGIAIVLLFQWKNTWIFSAFYHVEIHTKSLIVHSCFFMAHYTVV